MRTPNHEQSETILCEELIYNFAQISGFYVGYSLNSSQQRPVDIKGGLIPIDKAGEIVKLPDVTTIISNEDAKKTAQSASINEIFNIRINGDNITNRTNISLREIIDYIKKN